MVGKQHRSPYVWLKDKMKRGVHNISTMPEFISYKAEEQELFEKNREKLTLKLFDMFLKVQDIRRRHILTSQEKVGFKKYEFLREVDALILAESDEFVRNTIRKNKKDFNRGLIFGGKVLQRKHLRNKKLTLYAGSNPFSVFQDSYRDKMLAELQITNDIILRGRTIFAEQITKYAIDFHKQTYVPLTKMRAKVEKKFGKDTAPWNQVWNRWVWNQSYKNKHTKEFLKLKDTPMVQPGRPICTECKKKPCEPHHKNNDGYKTFLNKCSSCHNRSSGKAQIVRSNVKEIKTHLDY